MYYSHFYLAVSISISTEHWGGNREAVKLRLLFDMKQHAAPVHLTEDGTRRGTSGVHWPAAHCFCRRTTFTVGCFSIKAEDADGKSSSAQPHLAAPPSLHCCSSPPLPLLSFVSLDFFAGYFPNWKFGHVSFLGWNCPLSIGLVGSNKSRWQNLNKIFSWLLLYMDYDVRQSHDGAANRGSFPLRRHLLNTLAV